MTEWMPKTTSEVEREHFLELGILEKLEKKYHLSAFANPEKPSKEQIYQMYLDHRLTAQEAKKMGVDLF
jgi:hypothetical protein